MQWDMHMQCNSHTSSGAYVIIMKCKYTSACDDIVDCIELI